MENSSGEIAINPRDERSFGFGVSLVNRLMELLHGLARASPQALAS